MTGGNSLQDKGAEYRHLNEITTSSEEILKGSFLHAMRDAVQLPDGTHTTREYVIHPGAVMIVAQLDDGRLVLERQYRYPVKAVMIEFPAGKLDAGEDSLACAKRELLEETHWGLSPAEQGRVLWDFAWIWGPPEDHLAHLFRTVGSERFVYGTHWPLRLAQNPRANLDLLPPDLSGAGITDAATLAYRVR